jgi:hypothetical protein
VAALRGIDSYSVVPLTNSTADGGAVNYAENQAPSTVNNTGRQTLADIRSAFNDIAWFNFGTGDQGAGNLAVPSVYASGTSFTIAGADVSLVYHANRRVRAVGIATGTIYGTISSVSYNSGNTTTTVNVTWDSGSLSNETLVISLSQIPVTGSPLKTLASPILTGTVSVIGNLNVASSTTVINTAADFSCYTGSQKTTGIPQSSTVDIFRFLDQSGGQIGNEFSNGLVYLNIIDESSGTNQSSFIWSIVTTGNGSATSDFIQIDAKVRGSTLVAAFQLASDGAAGAAKIQIVTAASGKAVTARVTFVGQVQ